MRSRIRNNGVGSLEAHELLEYLLYPYVPRVDTNPIAHDLIDRFGSLSGVFNAKCEELLSVKGMTDSAALFLSEMPEVCRVYMRSVGMETRPKFKGKTETEEYIRTLLFAKRTEEVYALSFDSHDALICAAVLAKGSTCTAALTVHDVVEEAIRTKACSIILAHNHPDGGATPSVADVSLTSAIAAALGLIGVSLSDHVIVAKNEIFSFRDAGYCDEWRQSVRSVIFEPAAAVAGNRFFDGEATAEPGSQAATTATTINPVNEE